MDKTSKASIAHVAVGVVVVYLLWFLAPLLLMDIEPNASLHSGLDSIFSAGIGEVVVLSALLLLIGYLGWWRLVGLTSVNTGGFKFILLPLIYTMLLIAIAVQVTHSNQLSFFETFDVHTIALLLLISFMVGFNEEVIFRGFVFGGLVKKLSPLWSVIVCAMVFGLFHLVNLIGGQALDVTVSQVIQAASMGFLYAALRLRLGSVWPLILLHGLWDFSVSLMQQSSQLAGLQSATTSGIHPLVSMPVLLYGIFVYWRWRVTYTDTLSRSPKL